MPLLPGDLTPHQQIARILRVNHAGEYGAKRIYQGQLSVIREGETHEVIQKMSDQEEEHLHYFEQSLVASKVRPTLLMPLWHVGGYLLGAATALLGKSAAMACTEAVEEVIDQHYQEQLHYLSSHAEQRPLYEKIAQFREEEIHHKETAVASGAAHAPAYPLLTAFIRTISRSAIWIASRI